MGKKGSSIAAVLLLIILLLSNTCTSSSSSSSLLLLHSRRLITNDPNNPATNSQIAPIGSPVTPNPVSPDKEKINESQVINQNNINNNKSDNHTLPVDSKGAGKNETESKNSGALNPPSVPKNNNETSSPVDSKGAGKNETQNEKSGALNPPIGEKNDNKTIIDSEGTGKNETGKENRVASNPPSGKKNADQGDVQAVNGTTAPLSNDDNCEGYLTSCRNEKIIACIKAINDGSKERFLVVQNRGESDLQVTVHLPDSSENALPAFEVRKHGSRRMNIPLSVTVSKTAALIVNSGNSKCVLPLAQSVSVDNFIRQVSFYSRQVTPIYTAYGFFLLALLFGGTWACCKLRKKSRQEGIPYQELEMGLPESASAVNVDSAEGWDHDWDDDDWDEDSAVKSPGGHQIRSISVDGLTSRSSRKDGWEKDWED